MLLKAVGNPGRQWRDKGVLLKVNLAACAGHKRKWRAGVGSWTRTTSVGMEKQQKESFYRESAAFVTYPSFFLADLQKIKERKCNHLIDPTSPWGSFNDPSVSLHGTPCVPFNSSDPTIIWLICFNPHNNETSVGKGRLPLCTTMPAELVSSKWRSAVGTISGGT